MRTIYSPDHVHQHGTYELIDGKLEPPVEKPERAERILAAVRAAGLGPVEDPAPLDRTRLARVHTEAYLTFLEGAWDRWVAAHGDWDALPLNWGARTLRRDVVPAEIDGQLGYYSFDAGTPIVAGTWRAVTASAAVALTGADAVLAGARAIFSLCRPPGHHAAADVYGGYCFLNNAALAAQALVDGGCGRVALIDVDYHHGNGTQAIFEDRADVLFLSIHADPRQEFPYFLGHADETGRGAGEGFTANYPLPWGSDWPAYAEALEAACRRIADFGPDALVVSLGVDTYEGDPISQFRLTTEQFPRLGARLKRLGLPTLIVMEGGYAVDALGDNVAGVLTGFADG